MKFVNLIRKTSLFALFVALLLIGECYSQSYLPTSDTGPIKEIYGDKIYVQGELGNHIFEIISPCSWCELNTSVIVTFVSSTRATMVPEFNILQSAPIQLFIIKDGRERSL